MMTRETSKLVNDFKYICDEIQAIESCICGLQDRRKLTIERCHSEIAAIDEEIRNRSLVLQESAQRMVLYKTRLKNALNEYEEQPEVGSV